MKTLLSIFTFLFLNSVYAQGGIMWRTESIQDLFQESAQTGKLIFFVVKAKWCGNSERFLSDTLQDPKVIQFINATFIPKLVDEEDDKILAQKYRVFAFPGILVLDSKGEEIDRMRPYIGQDLINALDKIRLTEKTISELEKSLAKHPQLFSLIKSLFFKSARQIDIRRALKYQAKLSREHNKKYRVIREDVLSELALAYSFNGENREAIKLYREILTILNSDKARVYHSLSIEYFIANDIDEGFQTIRDAIREMPNDLSFYFRFLTSAEHYNVNVSEAIAMGNVIISAHKGSNQELAAISHILAILYKRSKQTCNAIKFVEKAVKLVPESDVYTKYRLELLKDPDSKLCDRSPRCQKPGMGLVDQEKNLIPSS